MIQNLSIPSVQAATFYVALLTLGVVLLGMLVVQERVKTKTSLGDGDHAALARLIRVHGNYSENVPFGLALLIMLAVTGATAWPVHVVGLCPVLGRITHAIGVSQSSGPKLAAGPACCSAGFAYFASRFPAWAPDLTSKRWYDAFQSG